MSKIPLLSHDPLPVVIVGGGPAGVSCALWCKNLGLKPTILESRSRLGGTPRTIQRPNRWIAGRPNLMSSNIAEELDSHCKALNIPQVTSVQSIEAKKNTAFSFQVEAETATTTWSSEASAIVVATGLKPRGREFFDFLLPAEFDPYIDTSPLGHLTGRDSHEGERSLVVGGADNAFFTVADLVESGAKVTLACRSLPKAQSSIQATIKNLTSESRVNSLLGTLVGASIESDGIRIHLKTDSEIKTTLVDKIYLRAGFEPDWTHMISFVKNHGLDLYDNKYPICDTDGRWSSNGISSTGIYCAGDLLPSGPAAVVTALANGALVAKTIEKDLRTVLR